MSLPEAIKLEITYNCNMTCDFCYNANNGNTRSKSLETKQALTILDAIYDAGVRQVRITGGEPFTHPGINEILTHAKSKGFFVRLNTNGSLITKTMVRKMKPLVDSFLFPLHDLAHTHVVHLQELLAACAEQETEANINTIISPDILANLNNYASIVTDAPGKWVLQRQVPTEGIVDRTGAVDLSGLVERLLELRKQGLAVEIHGLPLCACDPRQLRLLSTGSLNCGLMNQLVVGPDGTVRPCYSIDAPLGVLPGASLTSMWTEGLSADIRALRIFPKTCRDCVLVAECLGGCRFAACYLNGSYSALDPLAKPELYHDTLFPHSSETNSFPSGNLKFDVLR